MSSQHGSSHSSLVGIGLMCLALLCFSCLDSAAKYLNRSQDPLVTAWMRYTISVIVVTLALNPWTAPGVWKTQRPALQILRSLLLLGSTIMNFMALRHLQLAQTMAIIFATPLLVALISGPLLGEWIGPRRLIAVIIGFLGVLVVTRAGFGDMHPASLYSVAGVFCYAFYVITTRILAAHDSSSTTMVYSGLAGMVLLAPMAPAALASPLDAFGWMVATGMGFLGALGHWLLIKAHRHASAAILSPFIYTQMIWMILLGLVIFGDKPDRWTLLGATIVIGSGLYLLYREKVKNAKISIIN